MAELGFYREHLGIGDEEGAFRVFIESLDNYFDANYYVDWRKVLNNVQRFERELALLNTLCGKADVEAAAAELFMEYPAVVRALPLLMALRGTTVTLVSGQPPEVSHYKFPKESSTMNTDLAHQYASFVTNSGMTAVFESVKNLRDYATGVEVGMDTNGRKNRGGICGVKAVEPILSNLPNVFPGLITKAEARGTYLQSLGLKVPDWMKDLVWDCAFWTPQRPSKLALMEINHYGSTGSKPSAIAREYTERYSKAHAAGFGFIWLTDGLGWRAMPNPLREAFFAMPFLLNVRLSYQGGLAFALHQILNV